MKMKFRTDSPHYAGLASDPTKLTEWYQSQPQILEQVKQTPPAEPGDVWRIRWAAPEGQEGPLAGYAICCPRCREVHFWTTANNCGQGVKNGTCIHGRSQDGGQLGSCWQWTGSAEENTLTASPSLHASGESACGWHGWLRDGELTEA